MKNKMKKWSLWTCSLCASLCLGCAAVVATIPSLQPTTTTASAADVTTCTITAMTGRDPGNASFYANATSDVASFNPGGDDWSTQFSLVRGTGAGFALNGQPFAPASVKQPGGDKTFYIELGFAVKTGDVLTIDGNFANIQTDVRNVTFKFETCAMKFNGTIWETWTGTYVEPTLAGGSSTQLNLNGFAAISGNGITVNGENVAYTANANGITFNNAINAGDVVSINGIFNNTYAVVSDDYYWDGANWFVVNEIVSNASVKESSAQHIGINLSKHVGIDDWGAINLVSGGGIKFNGSVLPDAAIKIVGNWLYVDLVGAHAESGDNITIEGLYTYKHLSLVFTPMQAFVFDGTNWNVYEGEIGTVYKHTTNIIETTEGPSFYASLEGVNLPMSTWDFAYTLKSGKGVTLNNAPATIAMKPLGAKLYIETFFTPKAGDVLMIDGTYVCTDGLFTSELTFAKTQVFVYNGAQWIISTATTYDIGGMVVGAPSYNGTASTRPDHLYLDRADGQRLPVQSWGNNDVFTFESGEGLKVNGESRNILEMKSTDAGLWLSVADIKNGDVVTLSGTFFCEDLNTRYIIKESKFWWIDGKWVDYTHVEYETGKLFATNDSNAGALHLAKENGNGFEVTEGTWTEKLTYVSGNGVTLNGTKIDMGDIKIPGTLYVGLGTTVKTGDVVRIGGLFYNHNLNVIYNIEETELTWNGSKWINSYNTNDLADFDTVTLVDLGVGVNKAINGTFDGAGLSYTASAENNTGSVKLRFGYNSADVNAGCIDIRLRGGAWEGIQFRILEGRVELVEDINVSLNSNTDYIIELIAIDIADGSGTWIAISIDGIVMTSKVINTDWSTSHVSIYAGNGNVVATLTDPDHVAISYGDSTEYVAKGITHTVAAGTADSTFIGWLANDTIYTTGQEIVLEESIAFSAFTLDFTMLDGAAIRLSNTADDSGIRFTTFFNTEDFNALANYGITVTEFGTLIMPSDYLNAGQAPNLTDFEAGVKVLQITSTKNEIYDKNDAYTVYRGAMNKIKTQNYGRNFAGRGYMVITVNDETMTIYTPFSTENNVRSIATVAQRFMEDTPEYEKISDAKKAVVQAYANAIVPTSTSAESNMQTNYAAAYVCANKSYKKEQA